MPKFIEEISQDDLTRLFQYEDWIKAEQLRGDIELSETMRLLHNRMQKIYVVPTAKLEQHI